MIKYLEIKKMDLNMRLRYFAIFAERVIRQVGKCINDARIIVVDLIYMKNIKNPRESPFFKIVEGLGNLDIDMAVYNPFVPSIKNMFFQGVWIVYLGKWKRNGYV